MAYFTPNMEMPQEYIEALSEIALENNITAEQYAKQIIMSFIGKNHPRGLTKTQDSV